MSVEFHDNSDAVKAALQQAIIAGLEEAAGEVKSATIRNTRVKTGQTKGSWKHKVIDSELTAYIGSDHENAIWEEFGTGERAIPEGGGGRKGWPGKAPSRAFWKAYTATKELAKKILANRINRDMSGR